TPPSSCHTPRPVARRPGATLIKRAEAQRTKLLPRKIESPTRAGVGPKAPAQTEPIFNAMKAGLPLRNGEPGPDVGAGCPRTMKFGRCHAPTSAKRNQLIAIARLPPFQPTVRRLAFLSGCWT